MSVVNKAVVRRLYEKAFGQGKPEVLEEVLNPDLVCYDPTPKAERSGDWRPQTGDAQVEDRGGGLRPRRPRSLAGRR